jgi:hypothetical protein
MSVRGISFADSALGGQSALASIGERSPFQDNTPSLIFAKVVSVNYDAHTINCVGLSQQRSKRFDNVPVLSSAFTNKHGTTNLPVISAPAGSTDLEKTRLEDDNSALAAIAFFENTASKPVCIGFVYPSGDGEVLFAEEGLSIDRHNSNVYERLDRKGNWEFVFPDSTFLKIARTDELSEITDLTGKNASGNASDNARRKWQIDYDHDRSIILSHAYGARMTLGQTGLRITTSTLNKNANPDTGEAIKSQNLSWSFQSDGTITSNFTSLSFVTNIGTVFSIDQYGSLFTNSPVSIDNTFVVSGTTNLPYETYVDGKRIDLLISEIAQWYTNNHRHTYTDTYDNGGDTRWTDSTEITSSLTILPSTPATTGAAGETTTGADTGATTTAAAVAGATGAALATGIDPSKIFIGVSSSVGESEFAARADHSHGLDTPQTPTPLSLLVEGLIGQSALAARSDHRHQLLDVAGLKINNSFTQLNTFQAGLSATSPGLTGASRWMGATTSGAPQSGSYKKGDFVVDQTGSFWICTADGSQGTWLQIGGTKYGTSSLSTGAVNLPGTSLFLSRQDHVHSVGAATVGTVAIVNGSVTPEKLSFTAATQADLNAHTSSLHLSIGTTDSTAAAGNHTHTLQSFVVIGGETSMLSASAVTIGGAPLTLRNYASTGSLVISQSGILTLAGTEINLDASSVKINGVSIQNLAGISPGGGTTGIVSSQSASEYTYTLRAITTNDTTSVTLTTNSSSPSSTNMILVTAGEVWSYQVILTANSSAGTSVGRWTANGLIKRGATIASTTLVNDPGIEGFFEPALENCIISISAENTTYGALAIAVTGMASTSIAWTASVKVSGIQTPLASIPTETFGSSGSTTGYGRFTFASGKFVTDGDSQYGVQVLRGSTSDDVPLILTSNGLPVSNQNIPILSSNSSWIFDIKVAANCTGSKAALWAFTGLIRKALTNASTYMVGLIDSKSTSDPDLEDIEITIEANTTYGGINVQVKGIESTLLHWVATVQTTEVI